MSSKLVVQAKVSAALDRQPSVQNIGVAVSGGPDSVALLSALVRLAPKRRLHLTVLHVNHALRPEADQEQHLVESFCQRWQIPCVVGILSPPHVRGGIETWARVERYRFFQSARERYGLDAVALAHTLDDQAETVLFRLLRGSARRGLAGIPPVRDGWILRPLLECTRQEVMAYLDAQCLPYAVDSSNADLRYTRNKIRHVLLPFLEKEFSPQVRHRLAVLAKTFRVEEEWLEALATAARERVQEGPLALSLDRLAIEPVALQMRVLRQWLEQTGQIRDMGFRHLESLHALSAGRISGRIELPGTLSARREGSRLLLELKQAKCLAPFYRYALCPGQEVFIREGGWHVAMTAPSPWGGAHDAHVVDPWQAIFDAAALLSPLIVRNCQPGDRIRPLGMRGSKKVHDVFIDAKAPQTHRCFLPLVVIGAEIAWVPGYVRGETAKVTTATRAVCQITVNPLPEK